MPRKKLYQIECNIESVLKKHASALPVRDWHVAAASKDNGVICATVSHDVFCAETKGLTKDHWAEVRRILEEHLPAKFSGRWRVIRVALDYSPVVWLEPVDARNPRQHS
jgi:hypothetical protein